MRAQGLLDHAPVPQVEVLSVREYLGMWGAAASLGLSSCDGAPARQAPASFACFLPQPGAQVRASGLSRGPRI